MPRSVVEAADRNVTFSDGYPAWWACLLFKTSGVPLFSGISIYKGNPYVNADTGCEIEMTSKVKMGPLFRSIKIDVGGRSVVSVPRAASRRSWFVRTIPHIETRAVWRCLGRLARPQTP